MRYTDFMYDGRTLSDLHFIICTFNHSDGAENVGIGSEITFNKVSRGGGRKFGLAGTSYGTCITATFDICRDPCHYEADEMEVTQNELRVLTRWLNRRRFLSCTFLIDDDDESYSDAITYYASFNIERIMVNDKLCGLRLKMETDAPYGYGDPQTKTMKFTGVEVSGYSRTQIVVDTSDEIGDLFPEVKITCTTGGTLKLKNKTLDCETVIRNCSAGEVITLHGDSQIIETSKAAHKVCNDFNWEFFRIGNTLLDREENRQNEICASLPCTVVISYRPIIKDAP